MKKRILFFVLLIVISQACFSLDFSVGQRIEGYFEYFNPVTDCASSLHTCLLSAIDKESGYATYISKIVPDGDSGYYTLELLCEVYESKETREYRGSKSYRFEGLSYVTVSYRVKAGSSITLWFEVYSGDWLSKTFTISSISDNIVSFSDQDIAADWSTYHYSFK